MDAAVGLVEAYLYTNGYFTVTEYPIVVALDDGSYQQVTDVDILAVRLPGAGRILPSAGGDTALKERLFEPDPRLIEPEGDEWVDFIIGEVKEGKAVLNRGARDPNTLITAIRRFAFVQPETAGRLVDELISTGRARVPERKVQWRLFAFGGKPPDRPSSRFKVLLLEHCLEYMSRLSSTQAFLGATQAKNPTVNLLTILSKAGFLRSTSTRAESGRSSKGRRRR